MPQLDIVVLDQPRRTFLSLLTERECFRWCEIGSGVAVGQGHTPRVHYVHLRALVTSDMHICTHIGEANISPDHGRRRGAAMRPWRAAKPYTEGGAPQPLHNVNGRGMVAAADRRG